VIVVPTPTRTFLVSLAGTWEFAANRRLGKPTLKCGGSEPIRIRTNSSTVLAMPDARHAKIGTKYRLASDLNHFFRIFWPRGCGPGLRPAEK